MRSQFATASNTVPAIRSQNATASKRNERFLPYAFTEHGAIMAANVLSSRHAVEMSPALRDFPRISLSASNGERVGVRCRF